MIISASPCLKYSRPRFASRCPSQQRAQSSPVISDAFLRFIGRDNQNELTRPVDISARYRILSPAIWRSGGGLYSPGRLVGFPVGCYRLPGRLRSSRSLDLKSEFLSFSLNPHDAFLKIDRYHVPILGTRGKTFYPFGTSISLWTAGWEEIVPRQRLTLGNSSNLPSCHS